MTCRRSYEPIARRTKINKKTNRSQSCVRVSKAKRETKGDTTVQNVFPVSVMERARCMCTRRLAPAAWLLLPHGILLRNESSGKIQLHD